MSNTLITCKTVSETLITSYGIVGVCVYSIYWLFISLQAARSKCGSLFINSVIKDQHLSPALISLHHSNAY